MELEIIPYQGNKRRIYKTPVIPRHKLNIFGQFVSG